MKKNTGHPSEKAFEARWNQLGKKAVFFKLVDAAEIRGRSGKIATSARAQPSDYILTFAKKTVYAEVKSTINKTSFSFSLLKSSQTSAATRILAAGGEYSIFIHALATDDWYVIPYQLVMYTKKGSLKWTELRNHLWL